MKKMIIIEDPESCGTCPLHYEFYCPYLGRELGLWSMNAGKPTDCPLKPMPLKRETMIHWKSIGGGDIQTHEPNGEDIGWNMCVEYLEGEEYADK